MPLVPLLVLHRPQNGTSIIILTGYFNLQFIDGSSIHMVVESQTSWCRYKNNNLRQIMITYSFFFLKLA
jgi:hypothetical protein